MTIRILCTGDIHLGRRATQVPEATDPHVFRPTAAWQSFVDTAVERQVDIVVLTGDVVDETNKFYEAFSVLDAGVRRMVDEGIAVLAVAGNHDFDVLPRLADQIPDFHLLGRGGRWQEFIHEHNGAPAVRFQGWSFPARHMSNNPMATYSAPSDGVPTVGVLHCDCDVVRSVYGPVSLADLKGTGLLAWLLGHIHKPQVLSHEYPLIFYPGSLQGLDPGEPGMHSASLLTIGAGPSLEIERLALSGLRWEHLDVSVDSAEDEDSLQRALTGALRERHEGILGELGQTSLIACRLRLLGRTSMHRSLPSLIPTIESDLRPEFDGVEYFIESIENLSKPDISLEEIARSTDPAGLLARRLLLLERREPTEEYQDIVERAKRSIEEARGVSQFAALQSDAVSIGQEQVRGLLLQSGLRALDELLAQKEAAQ